MLDAVRCTMFHPDVHENDPEVLVRNAAAARRVGQEVRDQMRAAGRQDRVVGEYEPGSEVNDPGGSFVLRFLYAFWRLSAQRIAEQGEAPTTHAARVSAEQLGAVSDLPE